MKRNILYALLFCALFTSNAQKKVNLKVNPDHIIGHIDKKIYGLLLEHLYHSVSNGIWGETVWNRSFEELFALGGIWSVKNNALISVNAFSKSTARFNLGSGSDFELSLDFRKVAGEGGLLFCIRDQYRESILTNGLFLHLGTKNNSIHELESKTGWVWHTPISKTAIVDSKSGSLESGKWQTLKIICENKHITVLMDNQILFDNAIENCPLNGTIRIGVENCQAEFRNIKAKSLAKQELKLTTDPIRHWSMVGTGTIETTYNNVLNQNVAVHIQSSGKFVGIEQPKNYRIRVNDLLKGSLFVKGNVSKVYIQLLDGNKILSEKQISVRNNQWKEYPLELPVSVDCDAATLRISTMEKCDLYIDHVSFMHQSAISNGGYRPDLMEAVKEMKPTIIRWPGGSFSEHYDFENGIGPQSKRKGILRWDDFDPLSFGTDEFIQFCRQINAEPNIVVPIGYHNYEGYKPDRNGKTDWLQKALDWLEYCNGDASTNWGAKRVANGHPEPYNVKYWEIDNEVWKMDPKLYAEITRIFSQAMKHQDPSIKIIGCGSGRLGKEGIALDSIMIHNIVEHIDYISPHHYMELNKFGNDGVEAYGNYLKQLDSWIAKSKNPNMKIYVSEWNLEKTDMRTGLFAGGLLNQFEQLPRVEMAAPALALRHMSATGWDNSFINFDQNGYFVAPNYLVTKLWRDHYAPNLIELKSNLENLNAVATKSTDGKKIFIKIVNPSENEIEILIDILNRNLSQKATFQIIGNAELQTANTMEHPDIIKVENGQIKSKEGKPYIIMPKWSAAVVSFGI